MDLPLNNQQLWTYHETYTDKQMSFPNCITAKLIYLEVNGSYILLQGVHQVKSLKRHDQRRTAFIKVLCFLPPTANLIWV